MEDFIETFALIIMWICAFVVIGALVTLIIEFFMSRDIPEEDLEDLDDDDEENQD